MADPRDRSLSVPASTSRWSRPRSETTVHTQHVKRKLENLNSRVDMQTHSGLTVGLQFICVSTGDLYMFYLLALLPAVDYTVLTVCTLRPCDLGYVSEQTYRQTYRHAHCSTWHWRSKSKLHPLMLKLNWFDSLCRPVVRLNNKSN